jgi:CheY-like chemotaxis protein
VTDARRGGAIAVARKDDMNAPSPSDNPSDNPSDKKILVVNDTEEILELFRDIVEGMGHRMVGMSFAPDDLAAVKETDPDLAILDLMVGSEGHGWQLVQKMRMSTDTAHIPVIVCSAAVKDVREQEGWLTANGVKVVLKPFSVGDLELAITKALGLPEMVN